MATTHKCCECGYCLNRYQKNKCCKPQGLLNYDRGELVRDFAKFPLHGCETDSEPELPYKSEYDSDGSYDFEREISKLGHNSDSDSALQAEAVVDAADAASIPAVSMDHGEVSAGSEHTESDVESMGVPTVEGVTTAAVQEAVRKELHIFKVSNPCFGSNCSMQYCIASVFTCCVSCSLTCCPRSAVRWTMLWDLCKNSCAIQTNRSRSLRTSYQA